MSTLALDYAWLWDHGGDYPPGARLSCISADGKRETVEAGYLPGEEQVTVKVENLDDPKAVRNARRVQAFLDKAHLTVQGFKPPPDDAGEQRDFYVKVRFDERNRCEGTVHVKAANEKAARKIIEDADGSFVPYNGCGDFVFGSTLECSGPLDDSVEIVSVSEGTE